MRVDKKILIVDENLQKEAYEMVAENKYKKIEWNDELEDDDYEGIIGILYLNRLLKVQFKEEQII